MRAPKLAVALCVLSSLMLFSGCATTASLSTWQVDSLVKVFPDDKPGSNEADQAWLREVIGAVAMS